MGDINLPTPPGFQGLRDDLPLKVYVRNLPHWRQDGATYFVTFRQDDSVPASKIHELESIRQEWERQHPEPRTERDWLELVRIAWQFEEDELDLGHGSCQLGNPKAAESIVNALHYFDGDRYELGCYVVMTNHVHVVVRPLKTIEQPLERILQTWKRYTAVEINHLLNCSGTFWKPESFDRLIRDTEHLYRCIQYIGRNPGKSRRAPSSCRLWLRPEWQEIGWQFEEDILGRPNL